MNPLFLMFAALESLSETEQREPAPEGQCDDCIYKRLPNDGGHCYMFREQPTFACGQRKVETGGAK